MIEISSNLAEVLLIVFLIIFFVCIFIDKEIIAIISFCCFFILLIYAGYSYQKEKQYSYCEICENKYEIEYRYCPMDGNFLVVKYGRYS